MLYKKSVIDCEKKDFIFDSKPYNEDIDFKLIATIETFYEKNGYIPNKYIVDFLDWMTYMARINITNDLDDILESSFAGRCSIAQYYLSKLCEKFSFPYVTFNVGDILGCEPIHALTRVDIPTRLNGKESFRSFILDPTFRQFCLTEENRYDRYNEEPRWGVRKSTPHPGYFFNLTEDGKVFANNLISKGYFEDNDTNLKQYFDPFVLYITPKEAYPNEELVGKIASTKIDANVYRESIKEKEKPPFHSTNHFDFTTPKEKIEFEQRKLVNRIKQKFRRRELETMFSIDDENNTSIANVTK